MGLWNFFGGNEIGPGHPRYDRTVRKNMEFNEIIWESICIYLMTDGIKITLENYEENDVIKVLKHYPKCPKFKSKYGAVFGDRQDDVNNWNLAHKWLWEKEAEQNLQQGIYAKTEEILYIKKLEERINKLEAKLNQHEQAIKDAKENTKEAKELS